MIFEAVFVILAIVFICKIIDIEKDQQREADIKKKNKEMNK